jgi:hypothetical protein
VIHVNGGKLKIQGLAHLHKQMQQHAGIQPPAQPQSDAGLWLEVIIQKRAEVLEQTARVTPAQRFP